MLIDTFGQSYRILEKYFGKFNLEINQLITATIVKYDSYGEAILEPDHPHYRLYDCYPFIFSNLETIVDLAGNVISTLYLRDCYDDTVKTIPASWQLEMKNYVSNHVICKVTRIRKGRVFLEVVEQAY